LITRETVAAIDVVIEWVALGKMPPLGPPRRVWSTASIWSSNVRGSRVARSISAGISAMHSPRHSTVGVFSLLRLYDPEAISVRELHALALNAETAFSGISRSIVAASAHHPVAWVHELLVELTVRGVDSRASKIHLSWPESRSIRVRS